MEVGERGDRQLRPFREGGGLASASVRSGAGPGEGRGQRAEGHPPAGSSCFSRGGKPSTGGPAAGSEADGEGGSSQLFQKSLDFIAGG